MSALSSLDPNLRPFAKALVDYARQQRMQPRLLSTFRSLRSQDRLYQAYLSGRSTTVAAPPGRSLHNYGHAFDLKVANQDDQAWLGQVWEHWGGRWGGRFNDPNHFDSGATIG